MLLWLWLLLLSSLGRISGLFAVVARCGVSLLTKEMMLFL